MSREVLDGAGEVEIGIGVIKQEKSSTARHGALAEPLPCLWLCAGRPEKPAREPFALLEMAVRVVSVAASFVSFCLSTAIPVLGTVSRLLPACLKAAQLPLGSLARSFTRGSSFASGYERLRGCSGPLWPRGFGKVELWPGCTRRKLPALETWSWHRGAWGPAQVAPRFPYLAKQALQPRGDASRKAPWGRGVRAQAAPRSVLLRPLGGGLEAALSWRREENTGAGPLPGSSLGSLRSVEPDAVQVYAAALVGLAEAGETRLSG